MDKHINPAFRFWDKYITKYYDVNDFIKDLIKKRRKADVSGFAPLYFRFKIASRRQSVLEDLVIRKIILQNSRKGNWRDLIFDEHLQKGQRFAAVGK